jgi:myo-inositol-1(or 4)-monophosphatase
VPPVNLPLSTSGRTAAEVARNAALQAGETLRRAFRDEAVDVSFKGRADVVTDVDVAVERVYRDVLAREFPGFGFIGEESDAVTGTEPYTWIVDPIDGTANFAKGIPHFATTLALLHEKRVIAGITYDPVRHDIFTATAGGGMTVNGQPGSASRATDFSGITLGFDIASDEALVVRAFDIVRSLLPLHRVRLMGSGALGLAYVAVGWLDLYFHLELKPWDVAAGLLFIQESEGDDLVCVDAVQGEPATLESGGFLAGSEELVREFIKQTV